MCVQVVSWLCQMFHLPLDGRFLKRPGAADVLGALRLDNTVAKLEGADEAMLRLERDLSAQIKQLQRRHEALYMHDSTGIVQTLSSTEKDEIVHANEELKAKCRQSREELLAS